MIAVAETREQSRARYPDEEGYIERDGVRVFYEVYGDAPTTFMLMPTSPISHSRLWRGADPVPVAALPGRHFRPARQRPLGPAGPRCGVRDGGVRRSMAARCWRRPSSDQAVIVGPVRRRRLGAHARRYPSRARSRSGGLRAEHPVADTAAPELRALLGRRAPRHRRRVGDVQRPPLAPRLPRLPRVLLLAADPGAALDEADRGRGGVRRSRRSAETLILRRQADPPWSRAEEARDLCSRVRCPVLVIHGDLDNCQTRERAAAVAELTGGTLVTLEGAGHLPQARDPVQVNLILREFVNTLPRRSR